MGKKQGLGIKILAVVLGISLLLIPLTGCGAQAPPKTLIFADMLYDSIEVHNSIAAFILEHGYGYQSQSVPGTPIPVFEGLACGDIDISMECWTETHREAYKKHIASGKIVDLGGNFLDSWQGWLVPTSMIENGDLPEGVSVDDMAQYWELFKDPEDSTKGRFVNSMPGWGSYEINSKKLKAYGLDKYYSDFPSGSAAALSGSMATACEKGEPWFGYYWEPTWIMGKLDMTKIEEPPFDKEIWETTKGCAYTSEKVTIVVNASLPDRAPEVVEFLRKYETTCAQNNKMLAFMQENEASTSEAAIWFLKEYESLWTEWVPAEVASKVKAALP